LISLGNQATHSDIFSPKKKEEKKGQEARSLTALVLQLAVGTCSRPNLRPAEVKIILKTFNFSSFRNKENKKIFYIRQT